jgi:hypothetical protein
MRSVRTLAVPTFKNRTYEPRVEVLLADTLIKTPQEDGTYTIVSDDTADAILHCTGPRSSADRFDQCKTTFWPPRSSAFISILPTRSRIA